MCKKLVICLALIMASVSFGDTLIGNWEQQMDGWAVQGGAFGTYYQDVVPYTTPATLNEWALGLTQGSAGFAWDLAHGNMAMYLAQVSAPGAKLLIDVTWVQSEWSGTGIWAKWDQLALNSGGPSGWKQYVPVDTANPSYPGSWDPYNWGPIHTRTLEFSWVGYDFSSIGWGLQFILSTNYGGDTGMTAGNFYIDNARIIPEPATIAMLGLGGLALIRRKR